jgi:hypothetical protein
MSSSPTSCSTTVLLSPRGPLAETSCTYRSHHLHLLCFEAARAITKQPGVVGLASTEADKATPLAHFYL